MRRFGMRIKYPSRSKFVVPCEKAIKEKRQALLAGDSVNVRLSPRGYSGKIEVIILKTDAAAFEADWSSDPTRFPQRIKAAAWALFRTECFGIYEISHDRNTGALRIR